jgi:N-acetylmuramic acid 6-phosphate etherase
VPTESLNERSVELDRLTTIQVLRLINDEDATIASAVRECLPQVAKVVDLFVDSAKQGGRIFFVGAGTSGRLGAMEAAECPPTFGTPVDMVQAIVAGGAEAEHVAVESREDDLSQGEREVAAHAVGGKDLVIALTASGTTPFVLGALAAARQQGAKTAAIISNPRSMDGLADVVVEAVVGPEVIGGSTRMKAGTALKMILNMLTTSAMARLGRVYGNLMVDLKPTNAKLRRRAATIVRAATGASIEEANTALQAAGWSPKLAIVSILGGLTVEAATQLLERSNGNIQAAIKVVQPQS